MSHSYQTGSIRDDLPLESRSQSHRSAQHHPDHDAGRPRDPSLRKLQFDKFIQQQEGVRETERASSAAFSASRQQTREPTQYDRHSDMSSAKRKPSRSPDGSSNQRKVSRGASISKDGVDHQRKLSANANMISANMDPRKRIDKGNASVRSPISTDGSTYQDAASSRSTPQPQHSRQTATAIMTVVNGTNDGNDAANNSLTDLMVAYTSHLANNASLSYSRDVAKAQLENATAEFKNMSSCFQKFPAIKERTTGAKENATAKVAQLDLQMKSISDSQRNLATSVSEAIYSLFSQAKAVSRLPEPQPDAVSRGDYEGLQDRVQKQQDLLDRHQDRFEKQSSLIERLEKAVKETSEAATQARTQTTTLNEEITALKGRIYKVEASEQSGKNSLRDLTTAVSSHTKDIDQVKSDVNTAKSDLAASEDTLRSANSTAKSAASSASTVREDLGKIERQLTTVKNDVGQIWDEISEPGKDSVLRRLKRHDQTINNLWTKIETSEKPVEPARIELLEERVESLTQNLSNVRDDVRRAATSDATANIPAVNPISTETSSGFDLESLQQDVNDACERVDILSGGFDGNTASIEQLEAKLDSLSGNLEKLGQEHTEEIRQLESLDRLSNDKHALTSATCASIAKTITNFTSKADALQTSFESLSEMVKSLQRRPSQSSAANGPEVAQFRPLQSQSPHPANSPASITPGSAQTNGFTPPNGITASQHPTNGNFAGPINSRSAVNMDQIEGIWGSLHSLRQRFDNLTTEEVVKGMVEQSAKMYPAGKECHAATRALQDADSLLERQLQALDTRLTTAEQNIKTLHQAFEKDAAGYGAYRLQTYERFQKIEKALVDAQILTKQLAARVTANKNDADTAKSTQTDEINRLRSEVEAFAEVVFDKENE